MVDIFSLKTTNLYIFSITDRKFFFVSSKLTYTRPTNILGKNFTPRKMQLCSFFRIMSKNFIAGVLQTDFSAGKGTIYAKIFYLNIFINFGTFSEKVLASALETDLYVLRGQE